ncbi:MFS transporter [Amylibacter marinus]|uniref:MFS transporter n=1 Tax=Amylibacter marinus TaxID=1475483 RepID=A0ABQ5VW76_9RHOB|nr:MFS transporter [Amylibacter marinus]GLQ35538.1 MFS transporter [Amylibacter marinus]
MQFIIQNFRWLITGALMAFASCFGQTFFISIFADDIMHSYDITNTEWGRIYGIGTFASGILLLWAGGLADRIAMLRIAPAVLMLLAVFALLMAFNTSLVVLTFIIFGLRFAGQGMMMHISMVAMARWFQASRGRAVSLALLGYTAGEAILPLSFVFLLGLFSWQYLWIIPALYALVLIPVLFLCLSTKRIPEGNSELIEQTGMGDHHWTRAQALRHPLFWLLIPALITPSITMTALFFQQVNLTQEKGWAHLEFVALFPVFSVTTLCTMMVTGILVDRIGAARIMPIYQIPMAVGFLVLGIGGSITAALFAMILLGMMQGANTTVVTTVMAENYGTRHVGAIKATSTAAIVFGSAISPSLTGYLIDQGRPFSTQLPLLSILVFLTSGIAFLALRHYSRMRRRYT